MSNTNASTEAQGSSISRLSRQRVPAEVAELFLRYLPPRDLLTVVVAYKQWRRALTRNPTIRRSLRQSILDPGWGYSGRLRNILRRRPTVPRWWFRVQADDGHLLVHHNDHQRFGLLVFFPNEDQYTRGRGWQQRHHTNDHRLARALGWQQGQELPVIVLDEDWEMEISTEVFISDGPRGLEQTRTRIPGRSGSHILQLRFISTTVENLSFTIKAIHDVAVSPNYILWRYIMQYYPQNIDGPRLTWREARDEHEFSGYGRRRVIGRIGG